MTRRRASLIAVASLAALTACRASGTSPAPDPTTRLEECEALDGRALADDCYEKLGISAQKPGYCERIVGPRVKNACFEKVAPLVDDPKLCAKIDETALRGSCRTAVAKKRGDVTICATIERVEGQASCTKEIALAKKDVKLCESIAVVEARTDCTLRLANGNPDACKTIADVTIRDRCFLDVAQNTRSAAPCDKISDIDRKSSCILDIARRNNDDTLCAQISDTAKHDTCMKDAKSTPASASLNSFRKGVTRISDDHFEITRAALDSMLENQAELMRSARIVPEMENGKTVGIRIFGVRPDSMLGVLGFENGDRLEKVNGFEMGSPEKALEAYARLRTSTELVVELARRGASRKHVYTIK